LQRQRCLVRSGRGAIAACPRPLLIRAVRRRCAVASRQGEEPPAGAKAGSPAAAIGEEKAPDGCSFAGAKGCWSGEGDEGLGSTQLGCYTTTPGPRSGSSAPGEDRWVLQDGRWDAQRWRGLPTRSASQEKPGPTARVGRDRGWLISQFHAAQMAGVHSPVSSKRSGAPKPPHRFALSGLGSSASVVFTAFAL
jgi:hypothetical protein